MRQWQAYPIRKRKFDLCNIARPHEQQLRFYNVVNYTGISFYVHISVHTVMLSVSARTIVDRGHVGLPDTETKAHYPQQPQAVANKPRSTFAQQCHRVIVQARMHSASLYRYNRRKSRGYNTHKTLQIIHFYSNIANQGTIMNVCVLGLAFFIVVSTLRGTTCKKVKRGMYTSGELFFVFFLCMTEKCIR